MNKLFVIVVLLLQSFFYFTALCANAAKEYIPENLRARLPEIRECVKENSGDSWKTCRANCDDVCNEIPEPYERGVCNGVLIQLCCYEQPSGCK